MNQLSEDYLNRFSGVGRLYGFKALQKLSESHVAVIGIGGVGSWVVEALARSGVGEITLIDHDDVCVSNFNRQVHASDSSLGKFKVEVMAQRVALINRHCRVHTHQELLSKETLGSLLSKNYDYVVDAIDGISTKSLLIAECVQRHLPILVLGSVGGKRNPLLVKVDDLSRTTEDQLLMYVKKKLRQDYNFPRLKKPFNVNAIFSPERPVYFNEECVSLQKPKDLEKPLDCQSGMGTASFLSGTFGFVAASQVIQGLLQEVRVEPALRPSVELTANL